MDFKGWFRLGDGTRCDPLTMTDAHSRYLRCCKAGTAVGDTVSSTMRAQQRRFDAFQREYNEQRPHEALQQHAPAAVYVASSRPFPNRILEPEYPCWYEVLTPRAGAM